MSRDRLGHYVVDQTVQPNRRLRVQHLRRGGRQRDHLDVDAHLVHVPQAQFFEVLQAPVRFIVAEHPLCQVLQVGRQVASRGRHLGRAEMLFDHDDFHGLLLASAEGPEALPHLVDEDRRLLEGSKMAAVRRLIPVNDLARCRSAQARGARVVSFGKIVTPMGRPTGFESREPDMLSQ